MPGCRPESIFPAGTAIQPVLVMRRQMFFNGGISVRRAVTLIAGNKLLFVINMNQFDRINHLNFIVDVCMGDTVIVFVFGQIHMAVFTYGERPGLFDAKRFGGQGLQGRAFELLESLATGLLLVLEGFIMPGITLFFDGLIEFAQAEKCPVT